MKYPQQQFETLVQTLTILNEWFDLNAMHLSTIHYMVYQQFSEGQTHNRFYITDNDIKRAHKLTDFTGWTKLVDINKPFELYPDGCNDNHIETAVKRAIKQISVGVTG